MKQKPNIFTLFALIAFNIGMGSLIGSSLFNFNKYIGWLVFVAMAFVGNVTIIILIGSINKKDD